MALLLLKADIAELPLTRGWIDGLPREFLAAQPEQIVLGARGQLPIQAATQTASQHMVTHKISPHTGGLIRKDCTATGATADAAV
jgi:hypothetical protein